MGPISLCPHLRRCHSGPATTWTVSRPVVPPRRQPEQPGEVMAPEYVSLAGGFPQPPLALTRWSEPCQPSQCHPVRPYPPARLCSAPCPTGSVHTPGPSHGGLAAPTLWLHARLSRPSCQASPSFLRVSYLQLSSSPAPISLVAEVLSRIRLGAPRSQGLCSVPTGASTAPGMCPGGTCWMNGCWGGFPSVWG